MQTNEQEYIRILKVRLEGTLSKEELEDILSDYSEHFSIGRANGRTDEELWRSLGSPEDVAREIRAMHLVKKAEQARSAENIWHAVMATLGLGIFNLAVVLIPFILLIVFLVIIVIVGLALLVSGPLLLIAAVLQLIGVPIPGTWWGSPAEGVLVAIALTFVGVVMVIVDFHIARACYRLGIRYLKWNIRVIKGVEDTSEAEESGARKTIISREGTTALNLQLRQGGGEISIDPGSDDHILLDMTAGDGISVPSYEYSSELCSTTRRVHIRSRSSFGHHWWGEDSFHSWKIRLNREIPVALDIRNKAGRIRLALGELTLSSLDIRNGAGETRIDLGGYHGRNFEASIRNGVGSLVISMPKDSNLRVRISRGMGDVDVRGFIVEGDTYLTRTDRPGAPQITCQIRQGVGSIKLEAV